MVNSKKHMRGARGSWEEETGTPKRSNMAATAEPISNEQQASVAEPTSMEATPGQEESPLATVEPSLTELREMLVDIKIDICNILRENETTKNNMDELKATIRGQNVEIANLRASLNKTMKQFDDAERDPTETRKIVDQQQEGSSRTVYADKLLGDPWNPRRSIRDYRRSGIKINKHPGCAGEPARY